MERIGMFSTTEDRNNLGILVESYRITDTEDEMLIIYVNNKLVRIVKSMATGADHEVTFEVVSVIADYMVCPEWDELIDEDVYDERCIDIDDTKYKIL